MLSVVDEGVDYEKEELFKSCFYLSQGDGT